MEKKKREIMPVKTVTSPCSAPQVTFRQATRGVSNEDGRAMCLATSRRKMIVLPQLVHINIDSFVALVLGKFPCFLEIDTLFRF